MRDEAAFIPQPSRIGYALHQNRTYTCKVSYSCFRLKTPRFPRDTPNCSPLNSYKSVVPSRFFPVVLRLCLRGTGLATFPKGTGNSFWSAVARHRFVDGPQPSGAAAIKRCRAIALQEELKGRTLEVVEHEDINKNNFTGRTGLDADVGNAR